MLSKNAKVESVVNINKVFPNPANEELFINFESTEQQEVSIQIFDTMGRLKMNETRTPKSGSSTMLLDINTLNAGMYYLKVTDKNNKVQTKRFVKN